MRTLTQLTLLPLVLILITLFLWLFQYQRWRINYLENVDAVSQTTLLAGERLLLDLQEGRLDAVASLELVFEATLDSFGAVEAAADFTNAWQQDWATQLGSRLRVDALAANGTAFDCYEGDLYMLRWQPIGDAGRLIQCLKLAVAEFPPDEYPLAVAYDFELFSSSQMDLSSLRPGSAIVDLKTISGQAVAQLSISPSVNVLAMSVRMIGSQWRDFALLLGSFFVLATTFVFVRLALPLARIERSLINAHPIELKPLLARNDEIGRVARSLDSFFTQQKSLETEIEARQQAEASLELSRWNLRRAMERREQLARDLHDGMIQEIYSLGLAIKRLKRFFSESDKSLANNELDRISTQLNTMIAELRILLAELDPPPMQGEQFAAAIQRLAETYLRDAGVNVKVAIPDSLVAEIPRETRLQVFHIINEAFANAVRHGRAKTIECHLRRSGEEGLMLELKDDGCGFDHDKVMEKGGRGLRNMRERARAVGMDFNLVSEPSGTRIVLEGL